MNIKSKILSKSDQYNFYKSNYEKLSNKNKSLKGQNKKLKEDMDKLKVQNTSLSDDLDLIKEIMVNRGSKTEKNYCLSCGRVSEFESYGVVPRDKAICKYCKSFERDRLALFLFYQRYDDYFNKDNIKLLHFAPERNINKFFKDKENIDYFPVDFNPEIYEKRNIFIREKVDMENIPFDDESFDFIYNGHVLEHIPDDIKGLNELYRVLKKGGVCFVIIPLSDLEKTLENPEYSSPELRLEHYGQKDHLRKYGADFKDKLESVGFDVEEIFPEDVVEYPSDIDLFGLKRDDTFRDGFYICTK